MCAAETLRPRLAAGLAALDLPLSGAAIDCLLAYLALIQRWNRIDNLTAVRDPVEMVSRHLLDSLAVLPLLSDADSPLLDVGSGAGLPAIPWAIARPDWSITLLDAAAKRVRFLRQAIAELDLRNVTAVQARVQDYQPPTPFATLSCRAYASLAEFWSGSRQLCAPGGRLLALKGAFPDAEAAQLKASGGALLESHRLTVPGLAAERHLLVLRP